MTIYLAGSGPHICKLPLQPSTGFSTNTSFLDEDWVSTSLYSVSSTSSVETIDFGPVTEGWFHCEVVWSGSTSEASAITLQNDEGLGIIAIRRISSGLSYRIWDGAESYVVADSTFVQGQVDIYFKVDAVDGEVRFFMNRVQVGVFTGDTSPLVNVHSVRFLPPGAGFNEDIYASQILVCDFPTLFAKVSQRMLAAAGTYQEWDGAVTDINGAIPSTASFISTDVVGDRATYTLAPKDFAGYGVKGVEVQFSALRGGAEAANSTTSMIRVGGTDFDGAAHMLNFGSTSYRDTYENNPATGLPWTPTEAGDPTLEVGVKSQNV